MSILKITPKKRKLAAMHVSSKKKNTYVIEMGGVIVDPKLFEMAKETPLPLARKNGKKMHDGNWIPAANFPNPLAIEMYQGYKKVVPTMGAKVAGTIIEYLDKETGRPVVTVFPTAIYVHNGYDSSDFMQYMNHATRRDFSRQCDLRKNLLLKISEQQKQK